MNKTIIFVSVCMITYNHEKFISEAIEGVLMQKTDFPIELIIGEDCSTDKTREICIEYQRKYPNIIKLLLSEQNKGSIRNFIETMQAAQGKYIALCEGDDYWTDSYKLQKQVDFLEKNEGFVGCFHNSEERYYNNYQKSSTLYLNFSSDRTVTINDLTQANIVPTASVVFKNNLPKELFSDYFKELPVGDWPLHLLLLRSGNYYYIPQVMSVRNLNPESIWGMRDHIRNTQLVLKTYEKLFNSCWFSNDINEKLLHRKIFLDKQLAIEKEVDIFFRFKSYIKHFLLKIASKI